MVRYLRLRAVGSRAGAPCVGACGLRCGAGQGGLVASGFSEWPIVSLALGPCRRCAIIVMGHAVARAQCSNFLRYCGEHSIVLLAFFPAGGATDGTLLLRAGLALDIGMVLADRCLGRRRRRAF